MGLTWVERGADLDGLLGQVVSGAILRARSFLEPTPLMPREWRMGALDEARLFPQQVLIHARKSARSPHEVFMRARNATALLRHVPKGYRWTGSDVEAPRWGKAQRPIVGIPLSPHRWLTLEGLRV